MGELYRVTSPIAAASALVIRDGQSESDLLREHLRRLGIEFARAVVELCALEDATVVTPMGETFEGIRVRRSPTAVVCTKSDYSSFGLALAGGLPSAVVGFMDFGDVRGRAVLSAPIRELSLPALPGGVADVLVIAKSVLATGCTAVSLARAAQAEYRARRIVVASIFYSDEGVRELEEEMPDADLLVLGAADTLDINGMLRPGVGNLDRRLIDE